MPSTPVLLIVTSDTALQRAFERLWRDLPNVQLQVCGPPRASELLPGDRPLCCVVVDWSWGDEALPGAITQLKRAAPFAPVVALVDVMTAAREHELRRLGVRRMLDRATVFDMAPNIVSTWLEEAL